MKSRHLIEPEALEFIEGIRRPTLSRETLPQVRNYVKTTFESVDLAIPGVIVRKARAPGIRGEPDVSLIVYEPDTSPVKRGALLHIHGGGFVAGSPESEAEWSQWLVTQTGCVVVAPGYRLAPETTHPGPVMDCYATLEWIHNESMSLGVDTSRIAVYGGSTGGGLAAAVALMARDLKKVKVCFQCLLYPMLDDRTTDAPDENSFAGEYVWTHADNAFAWECLLGHKPGAQVVSQYASPARATDLAGLPPTFIWVGALDLFVE
jgi:acetyl esterase/lipase